MCKQHTHMQHEVEHAYFDNMPVRWCVYISILRDFEKGCCDPDKSDIMNEFFMTTLAQTNASEFDKSFIQQLLIYYRSRITELVCYEAHNTDDNEHMSIHYSQKNLYASQANILVRELIRRRQYCT